MVKDRGTKLVRHIRSNIAGYVALTLALSLSPAIANHLNVQTSDIANGAVTRQKIDGNAVNGAKIAPLPEERVVGTAGQPQFSNGGEGDCEWLTDPGLVAAHFYKDQLGFVHLGGVAFADGEPGGDAICNAGQENQLEDGIVFRLPADLRPMLPLAFEEPADGFLIVGQEAIVSGEDVLPAGSVFVVGGGQNPGANLEGIVFRTDAAGGFSVLPGSRSPALSKRATELIFGR